MDTVRHDYWNVSYRVTDSSGKYEMDIIYKGKGAAAMAAWHRSMGDHVEEIEDDES